MMVPETGRIATANALYRSGAYREALAIYEEIASRPGWAKLVRANILLCSKRLDGHINKNGKVVTAAEHPAITVTLTTIRSRLKYVPKVVESLLSQTLPPTYIDLNISAEPYLLDEGVLENDPILLNLMEQPLLRVNWVFNTGPYRKIWGVLKDHFFGSPKQDRCFVTVDDDTLYPSYFLEQLYESYLRHDCVIAFRGRYISLGSDGIASYDKWKWGEMTPSLNNLPTGKDGVFYSTKFFTADFLKLEDAQRIAPTADDLWIKWHCALNGVPAVILNPEACSSDYKSFPVVNYDKSYRNISLYAMHNSSNAKNKNDVAVLDLERYFLEVYGYNLAWLIQSEQEALV